MLHTFKSELLSKLNFVEHAFFGKNTVSKKHSSYLSESNLEYIAKFFRLSKEKLLLLKQVHGNKILQANTDVYMKEADGLITQNEDHVLCIYSADCMPILIAEKTTQSVIALHCGWRGLINGIIKKMLEKIKIMTSQPDIIISIGPCIHQNNYEVDDLFYKTFIKNNALSDQFFIKSSNSDRYLFNLPYYCRFLFLSENIPSYNIEILPLDTYHNENIFFSHRKNTMNHTPKGRQLSCIKIKNKERRS